MNIPNYDLEAFDDNTVYGFSVVNSDTSYYYRVVYTPTTINPDIYNLGFGVLNADGKLDDTIEPGIGNISKVIKTVGITIYKFTEAYSDRWVYFSGNTAQKRTLYNRVITNNYQFLAKTFIVLGKDYTNKYVEFELGHPYGAFLVKRLTNI